MTTSPSIFTRCPHCHSKFQVGSEHVGRRAKCSHCGERFLVAPGEHTTSPELESSRPTELIPVVCRLCGTRMYGTRRQLGEELKCPDCYTRNVVKPVERRAGPARPAALDGEQYELWEGEEQPWGITLAAEQEKLIPIRCGLCESPLYVPPELVGQKTTCPDCGFETPVRPVSRSDPAGPRPVPAGEEYDLEQTVADNSSLEPSAVEPVHVRLFEEQDAETRERLIAQVATNRRSRPRLPKRPLLTGYQSFFTGPGVAIRFLTLTAFLALATLMVWGAASLASQGPSGIQAHLLQIVALALIIAASIMGGLALAGGAACAIAIVTETSEGNECVQEWPSTNPPDWMGESLLVALSFGAAGLPGGLMARGLTEEPLVATAMILVSLWLFFPITLLSALEGGSPLALFMPGILGSVVWQGPRWLAFYVLSALLLGAVAGTTLLLVKLETGLATVAVPLVVAAVATYFRMLGRLAWSIRT